MAASTDLCCVGQCLHAQAFAMMEVVGGNEPPHPPGGGGDKQPSKVDLPGQAEEEEEEDEQQKGHVRCFDCKKLSEQLSQILRIS